MSNANETRQELTDAIILGEIKPEVKSIVADFPNFERFKNWFVESCSLDKLTNLKLYDLKTRIDLAYLFGFESKPDEGIETSLGTRLKNASISVEESSELDKYFYAETLYQGEEPLETTELSVKTKLSRLMPRHKVFTRIKQPRSLMDKIEKILKDKGSIEEMLSHHVDHGTLLSRPDRYDSSRYLDDLIGADIVIQDQLVSPQNRSIVLSQTISQTMRIASTMKNVDYPKLERKDSRVPGYESANIYLYGPIEHKMFGVLPIKLQIRFRQSLFQESAMYYVYKNYGVWKMPSWAKGIDYENEKDFSKVQDQLFQQFKSNIV